MISIPFVLCGLVKKMSQRRRDLKEKLRARSMTPHEPSFEHYQGAEEDALDCGRSRIVMRNGLRETLPGDTA